MTALDDVEVVRIPGEAVRQIGRATPRSARPWPAGAPPRCGNSRRRGPAERSARHVPGPGLLPGPEDAGPRPGAVHPVRRVYEGVRRLARRRAQPARCATARGSGSSWSPRRAGRATRRTAWTAARWTPSTAGRRHLEVRIDDHCIGCGLCATNCPYESIQMVARDWPAGSADRGGGAEGGQLRPVPGPGAGGGGPVLRIGLPARGGLPVGRGAAFGEGDRAGRVKVAARSPTGSARSPTRGNLARSSRISAKQRLISRSPTRLPIRRWQGDAGGGEGEPIGGLGSPSTTLPQSSLCLVGSPRLAALPQPGPGIRSTTWQPRTSGPGPRPRPIRAVPSYPAARPGRSPSPGSPFHVAAAAGGATAPPRRGCRHVIRIALFGVDVTRRLAGDDQGRVFDGERLGRVGPLVGLFEHDRSPGQVAAVEQGRPTHVLVGGPGETTSKAMRRIGRRIVMGQFRWGKGQSRLTRAASPRRPANAVASCGAGGYVGEVGSAAARRGPDRV